MSFKTHRTSSHRRIFLGTIVVNLKTPRVQFKDERIKGHAKIGRSKNKTKEERKEEKKTETDQGSKTKGKS